MKHLEFTGKFLMPEHLPLSSELSLPYVSATIYAVECEFLLPYLKPFGQFVDHPEEADFILSMNSLKPNAPEKLRQIRCYDKPVVWWTIEDHNSFGTFIEQARFADYVFTTDEVCVSQYYEQLNHNNVYWLPLACSPQYHRPLGPVENVTDFVISGNWYSNEARQWGVKTVVDPLVLAGYSLSLFCYKSFMWPEEYRQFWRGEMSCRTVSEQYRHGRVVLGVNNQRSCLDGYAKTYMTSMRTFEALACEKPFLAAYSDAYERLGLIRGVHMVSVDNQIDTLAWAERLLDGEGDTIAKEGRQFILTHHTYVHRLARIEEIVFG